jgi:uncharacterized surface protein with fasciclin (FAS1) repeats
MKITFFDKVLLAPAMILVCGFLGQGCTKTPASTNVPTNTSTITTIIHSATNTTLLAKALTSTGLDSIFNQPGPYTFFVLTDNVLAASGINDSVLNSYPDSVLRNLILYHTLAGEAVLSANFPAGPNAPIIMANGDSVFATINGNGLFINGYQVTAPDVAASNGLLDVISHILFPAKGTILQTLQQDSAFSLLLAAINRASQGSSNMDSILSGNGPFTLFAPVNTAFNAAGYASINDINNADPDSLANIISYHLLTRRYFTSDMVIGDTPVTLNDSSFTVIGPDNNSWQIQGKANTSPSNILFQNVMAQNGVLQGIDQLLLP